METDLLPTNATAFEEAAAAATDVFGRLELPVDAIPLAKLVSPPESYLPFLAHEYGLGPITPYVPDLASLIDEGVDWTRVRGTPASVAQALGWVGFTGDLVEAPAHRARWHLFDLALAAHWGDEPVDLAAIAAVVGLSVPVRSHFWRGFHGYDVRPVDWSYTRWGDAAYSRSAGVRLDADGPIWSFGRTYDFDGTLGEADLTALGAWSAEIGGTPPGWDDVSWDASATKWSMLGEADRAAAIAADLAAQPVWAVFRDPGGSVLGYRKARVARGVALSGGGLYAVGPNRYAPSDLPDGFYLEFLTAFGEGYGATAAATGLLFDAIPADTAKPGLQWAGPGELTGGVEVALDGTLTAYDPSGAASVDTNPAGATTEIEFGQTTRERVRLFLTF